MGTAGLAPGSAGEVMGTAGLAPGNTGGAFKGGGLTPVSADCAAPTPPSDITRAATNNPLRDDLRCSINMLSYLLLLPL